MSLSPLYTIHTDTQHKFYYIYGLMRSTIKSRVFRFFFVFVIIIKIKINGFILKEWNRLRMSTIEHMLLFHSIKKNIHNRLCLHGKYRTNKKNYTKNNEFNYFN